MARRRSGLGGLSTSDPELLAAALVGYDRQRSEIEQRMAEVRRELGVRGADDRHAVVGDGASAGAPKKRGMSAAARKRIAAAQRKRWAKFHKTQQPASVKQAASVPKRKMSAAGRKRIAEATKKRWAKSRAKKATAKRVPLRKKALKKVAATPTKRRAVNKAVVKRAALKKMAAEAPTPQVQPAAT